MKIKNLLNNPLYISDPKTVLQPNETKEFEALTPVLRFGINRKWLKIVPDTVVTQEEAVQLVAEVSLKTTDTEEEPAEVVPEEESKEEGKTKEENTIDSTIKNQERPKTTGQKKKKKRGGSK